MQRGLPELRSGNERRIQSIHTCIGACMCLGGRLKEYAGAKPFILMRFALTKRKNSLQAFYKHDGSHAAAVYSPIPVKCRSPSRRDGRRGDFLQRLLARNANTALDRLEDGTPERRLGRTPPLGTPRWPAAGATLTASPEWHIVQRPNARRHTYLIGKQRTVCRRHSVSSRADCCEVIADISHVCPRTASEQVAELDTDIFPELVKPHCAGLRDRVTSRQVDRDSLRDSTILFNLNKTWIRIKGMSSSNNIRL